MQNTEGSCKLNELVSVAANNRLHRNIEEVENLNEPEEARLMAGFFRSTRLQRNKQVQKRNLSAIAHQIYKKRTFTRPNSQKRTRNVFTRLNNYSRTRSADSFDGSTARTGQNGKLSHQKTVNGTRNSFADREALAGCRGAVLTRFVEPHRVAKGCPLWHKRRSETPRFVYAAYRACVLGEQKNAVHTAHTMTHIITHNSKHTAHTITHTLTHKKDHNPIDTPQNNPHKRRVNHFAVFVPQPFRAIDKLAVRESHEVRTYTNSP